MLVFISGMPRSGSTYSFNVAKQLLQRRGTVTSKASPDVAACLGTTAAQHLIMKGHSISDLGIELISSGAMKSVCTVRAVDDAVASWMQTFNADYDSTIEVFREWRRVFGMIHSHSLILEYEFLNSHPYLAAMKISKFLLGEANPLETYRIAQRFNRESVLKHVGTLRADSEQAVDVKFSYFHRDTFYHRNHIRTHPNPLGDKDRGLLREERAEWAKGVPIPQRVQAILDGKVPPKTFSIAGMSERLRSLKGQTEKTGSGVEVGVSSDFDMFVKGAYPIEKLGEKQLRWTGGSTEICVLFDPLEPPRTLSVSFWGIAPADGTDVNISANDVELFRGRICGEVISERFPLPKLVGTDRLLVKIESSTFGASDDDRRLGVAIKSVAVS